MRLLLFSNSTNAGEEYLNFTIPYISNFLRGQNLNAAFIPFAGISVGFDRYFNLVSDKLSAVGIHLESIHHSASPKKMLEESELIIVGGGNTFYLLKSLQDNDLLDIIWKRVSNGTPYIGWSAGSNIVCPTIKTTNDMPVVEPKSFDALNLIPFQINPHYTDYKQENHAGETREMRIREFLKVNSGTTVVGLREGTLILVEKGEIALKGSKPCKIFQEGKDSYDIFPGENLNFLLH